MSVGSLWELREEKGNITEVRFEGAKNPWPWA